ncbi:MAG TPA: glycosyltransferase, partial [Thermoguttaceae bacterium]|nr:glycosyltransferase [Thermoguttaceae bacterium]
MKPIQQNLVDLVLPVFNEAHVLEPSVERLHEAMAGCQDFSWRIVIVDNGSTDQTAAVAERLVTQTPQSSFLHLDAKGRGGALRATWLQT